MKFFLIILLLISSPCWAGVQFDGTDDRIDLQTVTNPTGNAFTISVWLNTNTITSNDYILNVNTAGGTRTFTFLLSGGFFSGTIQFQRIATTTDLVRRSAVGTITTGTWYNIIVTHDGTLTDYTTIHIYKDGTETSYESGQSGVGTEVSAAGAWMISGRTSDNAVNFDGKISEVAYWNVVLTQAEITQLASSKIKGMPLQIRPASLLGYWPLDDQPGGTSFDGDTANDKSGNGKYGTGNDGPNNAGLTALSEEVLTYP